MMDVLSMKEKGGGGCVNVNVHCNARYLDWSVILFSIIPGSGATTPPATSNYAFSGYVDGSISSAGSICT